MDEFMEELAEKLRLGEKIQTAFYFLDYLRLNQLCKERKWFRKNRKMMSIPDRHDPKTGYKAYIYRIITPFIDNDFSYLQFNKPRNIFGYDIGYKDTYLQCYQNHDGNFRNICIDGLLNKFLYIARRSMLYGENKDLVLEYRRALDGSKYINQRNSPSGLFFSISFDEQECGAYDAIQDLYKLKALHEKFAERYNPEEIIKRDIVGLLNKTLQLHKDQEFYITDHRGNTVLTAKRKIQRVIPVTNSAGKVITLDISSTINDNEYFSEMQPILSGKNTEIMKQIKYQEELVERLLDYVVTNARQARNLTTEMVFNIYKPAFMHTLSDLDKKSLVNISFPSVSGRINAKLNGAELTYRDNPEAYTYNDDEDENITITFENDPIAVIEPIEDDFEEDLLVDNDNDLLAFEDEDDNHGGTDQHIA